MQIELEDIPPEGLSVSGTYEADIFHLGDNDDATSLDQASYDLVLTRLDTVLSVVGAIRAKFEVTCIRSLERFPIQVELSEYENDVEIGGAASIDLTDTFREDILLALPTYPKKPDSNIDDRLNYEFEGSREAGEDPQKNVWAALDGLDQTNDTDNNRI